jgi:hypothetical protein
MRGDHHTGMAPQRIRRRQGLCLEYIQNSKRQMIRLKCGEEIPGHDQSAASDIHQPRPTRKRGKPGSVQEPPALSANAACHSGSAAAPPERTSNSGRSSRCMVVPGSAAGYVNCTRLRRDRPATCSSHRTPNESG